MCGNEYCEKETKHMLQLLTYYILDQGISIDANVDIAKVKEKKQIVFVDAMLIALAKILECKGSIFPSSFYVQLSNYQPYLHVDEFLLFLLELNKIRMLDESKNCKISFYYSMALGVEHKCYECGFPIKTIPD